MNSIFCSILEEAGRGIDLCARPVEKSFYLDTLGSYLNKMISFDISERWIDGSGAGDFKRAKIGEERHGNHEDGIQDGILR